MSVDVPFTRQIDVYVLNYFFNVLSAQMHSEMISDDYLSKIKKLKKLNGPICCWRVRALKDKAKTSVCVSLNPTDLRTVCVDLNSPLTSHDLTVPAGVIQ